MGGGQHGGIFIVPTIIVAALVFAGAFLLILAACSYLMGYVSTHPPRRRIRRTPAQFGAPFTDVKFRSRDETPLSGWYVAGRDPEHTFGVVILCHGMMATREEALPWARLLWYDDFALLLFDFRSYGRSGGDRCTAGYNEPLDLLGAVDYLSERADTADLPIGVFGFSMGGAAAIRAAAEDERIAAVATHGAFATLEVAVTQRCRKHFGPFGPLVERMTMHFGRTRRWFEVEPSAVKPIDLVDRLTPRPLMIIHGTNDRVVPASEAIALHEAAGHPKSLHMLPRSGHGTIHRSVLTETHAELTGFFRRHVRRDVTDREKTHA